ncbi:hypothetical protein J2X54_003437 [Duganella sp. 3397]|uniref:hypothetical protein n=1 Tax=Duganella sp. 3397 TaxID=2817732 RepID=UPI002865A670|nr:hypothetical protein [Duganella sp. 3397]MDR7050950.1 hypothetical protein [Duganella sp. 3397]
MLFPRHPQPVGDNRPVAVKIIQQEQGQSGAVDRHVLVVDQPALPAAFQPKITP